MRAVDPRLLRQAGAARGYLAVVVLLGLTVTALVLAQAGLLARALASAAPGTGPVALRPVLAALLVVVLARAAAAYGGEVAALRASAAVKSQLRRRLAAQVLRLGPAWLGGQRAGEITTLATRGLDGLDPYFARYLPQLALACLVPLAVVVRVRLAPGVVLDSRFGSHWQPLFLPLRRPVDGPRVEAELTLHDLSNIEWRVGDQRQSTLMERAAYE